MTYSNGLVPSLFIVSPLSILNTPFLPAVSQRQIATADEAFDLLHTHNPDAILAPVTHPTQRLFQKIKSELTYPRRPLLVMLTDDPVQEEHADVTMSPGMVGTQLEAFLKLRQETLTLYRQEQNQQNEITALKRELHNERRIKDELEVLKNAIVRNVSHELKTPLLQVKSAVALLDKPKDDEERLSLIELATTATARLELVVRNITMLGGSLESNPSPIILSDAVESARRQLRRLWEHRDQTSRIQVDLPTTLPPVLADKQGISTVFQLLLDNALKFSKDSSDENVWVTGELQGDKVRVCVQDFGIGIEQHQREAIFDMFYQVDSSSTRRYGGTGVGLAIVRLILENHGSQIHVESEMGKGSTFSFDLPAVTL